MSQASATPPEQQAQTRREGRPEWAHRLIVVAAILIVVIAGGFIGAAFVPRWWAQRIGDQADGSMAAGILLGLFYGFVFTALPLAVLALAARWRRSRRTWIAAGVVALVLAAPNLMTLGIALGTGSGAHAGDRILDVEGPGFRGATLAGAAGAVLFVVFVAYLLVSRRRARRNAARARAELDSARSAPPPESPPAA